MTKVLTRDSSIVRIYQCDTEDNGKVVGMIESLDGSGASESFTDADKLQAILGWL